MGAQRGRTARQFFLCAVTGCGVLEPQKKSRAESGRKKENGRESTDTFSCTTQVPLARSEGTHRLEFLIFVCAESRLEDGLCELSVFCCVSRMFNTSRVTGEREGGRKGERRLKHVEV